MNSKTPPTLAQILVDAEGYARIAFSGETFPHGMTYAVDGGVTMLALTMGVADASAAVRAIPCFAAALMAEAWGANREDIIAINVDHPAGVRLGRIDVSEVDGKRVLGPCLWTDKVVMPTADTPQPFVPLAPGGRLVTIRTMKVGGAA